MSGIDLSRIDGITGFLTPLAQQADERGRIVNVFGSAEDVRRIEAGYACGNCCATFDRFRLDCPLCRMPTHVTKQRMDAPPELEQYYEQHRSGVDTTKRRSANEALYGIAHDPDVEQIPLSKLTPKRRPH